jgi:retron-type reverse transcriptase
VVEPPTIEGFKTITTLRSNPLQKVRLLALVRNNLFDQVKVRPDLMSEDFPSIWIELNGLLVCSFYREWINPQAEKLDILLSQIKKASSSKKNLLVMGDCNLDQNKWNNPRWPHFKLAEKLRTGVAESGLSILPMGDTYFAYQRSVNGDVAQSALDHIYSSASGQVRTRVLSSTASDHKPIMAEVEMKKPTKQVTSVTKRSFKSFENEAFKRDLSLQDFASLTRMEDVDDMVVAIEAMINCVLDSHAPYKLVTMKSAFKKGLSQETKKLMKERNKVHRKMSKLSGDQKFQVHLQYRKLRNKCVSLQKKDTIQNNVDEFSGLNNPKDIWKATKSITSPRTQTELKLKVGSELIKEESAVAEVISDFFITKVEGLRNSINASNLPDPLSKAKDNNHTQFFLKTVSEQQVLNAINKLKNKSSSGLDQITSHVLKAGGEVLAVPLCYIINTSIISGKFPGRWKMAKLIPLHKKGDTEKVNNYRPVANLCVISKVLEMVVHNQISSHCHKEGIIPKHQHGFQKGKSTQTALISMYDQWQQAMEQEQSTGVILFDLSAAFDTLDHGILARKLTSLNFSDQSLKWVKSFLEARQQQVQVGKALSSVRHLDIGVPQGSVISPLLFLLYIQDMEQWIKSASITGYADDTSLTMSSWDMESLLASLETEAAMILDYMAVNKLVANADKTKFLLIRGKRHKKWPEVKIKVGNSIVNESQSEKILGVTVNNKLKWDEHHNNITNTLREYNQPILKRLAYHLPRWVVVKLLDALVFSSIRYCIPLW